MIYREGVTPILLHHFRKVGKSYTEPPELEDLSQAGIAEFGRQFILLKRREAYEQDGNHCLWLVWGGSAGHQGQGILEAHDGVYPDRKWEVKLSKTRDWEAAQKEKKDSQRDISGGEFHDEVKKVIGANPGISQTALRDELGVKKDFLRVVLESLEATGEVRFESGPRGSKRWFLVSTTGSREWVPPPTGVDPLGPTGP
jgi:DNA-binding MarR family transcriptional regulator